MKNSLHPDVSVIIVSYNVRDHLRRCLESLFALYEARMAEVFVIDNASTDGSEQVVREQFPWVTLVPHAWNLGFASGVNQGLVRAQGAFILLLNPDTVLCPDTVERFVAFMRAHPDCGIVGGQLLNPDHSPQESFRTFPTPVSSIAESLFLTRLWGRLRRPERPCAVDVVVGACLMARREMVQEIGFLDEQFFLYFEEIDWCRRARQQGWGVYTLPDAPVIHGLGRSTEARPDEAFVELSRSRALYMQKHFSRIGRWVTHGVITVGVMLRVILWGLALSVLRLQRHDTGYAARKFSQNRAVLLWYLQGRPNEPSIVAPRQSFAGKSVR